MAYSIPSPSLAYLLSEPPVYAVSSTYCCIRVLPRTVSCISPTTNREASEALCWRLRAASGTAARWRKSTTSSSPATTQTVFRAWSSAAMECSTSARSALKEPTRKIQTAMPGTTPEDNPFFGKPGYKPEIYTLGHRSPQGLAVHPGTGQVWEVEMGPNGGDELNVLRPGANCGIDLFANRDRVEPAVLGHDGALTLGPSQPTLSSS